jgi:lysophospholipase L1-like esterase
MNGTLDPRGACANLVAVTACLAGLAAANPALGAPPYAATQPAVRIEHWQQRLLAITAELERKQDLGAMRLVFLGDSITDFWQLGASPWFPGQNYGRQLWDESFGEKAAANRAINLGISGDRTEHVLYRILPRDRGGLGEFDAPELDPDFVVLMIGINNTWGGEDPMVDSVSEGIRAVVDAVHASKPRAVVILQSLLPTNEPAKNRDIVAPVNARLVDLAHRAPYSTYVRYLDVHLAFVDGRGVPIDAYFIDGVHPNEHGYRAWRDLLVPFIAMLRGDPGTP